MSKYNNKRIQIDGYKFMSIAEGNRYRELKLLLRAGEISDLVLQPKFKLQDSFTYNKQTVKSITYISDFKYFDKRKNKVVVEDVKRSKNKGIHNQEKVVFK